MKDVFMFNGEELSTEWVREDILEPDWRATLLRRIDKWAEDTDTFEKKKIRMYLDEFYYIKKKCEIIEKAIKALSEKYSGDRITQINEPIEINDTPYILTILIELEDDQYVSYNSELDISSQGDTIIDAILNIKSAIQLFFKGEEPDFIERELKKLKRGE